MNNKKTVIILGGTGFVGRAVTEKYLKHNWRVIIPTRSNIDRAKYNFLLHGFSKNVLEGYIANNIILFAPNVDLSNPKWTRVNSWTQLLIHIDISNDPVSRIINLVGETSKSAVEILKSNVDALESVFTLVKCIKSKNNNVLFINMGSVAKKKSDKYLSPYEYSKKIARQKIEKSNLCDFYFVAHYIKGKGEQKVKLAASKLWRKLKYSRKWLFGFKVSVIDVDDLAEIIYHIIEINKIIPRGHKPIELNVTNGELIFGEMIKRLLSKDKRNIPKQIIPRWLENSFLYLYSIIIPIVNPNDQFARRLASYAKRGLSHSKKQIEGGIFKTTEEIKNLALDTDNYDVLGISPNLIVASKHSPEIYVLRERNKVELERLIEM